jgi:ribonucleoside-triphosphate reductase
MTKILKSNGQEEELSPEKVLKSIIKAMKSGSGLMLPKIANVIVDDVTEKFSKKEKVKSSDIDKFILNKLEDYGQTLTANAYERYKTIKKYQEQDVIIDDDISGIVDGSNLAATSENANKDARMISTQRDLIAGTASRSFSERKIMPTYLLNAHKEGLIHIHDTDYMMNKGMFNCCVWNLKDMLDNGTVINGKMIERPNSLRTAATVATQISLSIASGQYGGQTLSISHLAPYVRVSYEKYYAKYKDKYTKRYPNESFENIDKWAKEDALSDVKQEIKDSVQIISYQINTFNSTNGQTPFCSLFLYLREDEEYIKETAMLIEEVLKQRILGIKNEYGVYTTPAFPKLLYVLDDNNVPKDSEYRYLTDLAIKCSSKRMNPDYISAKIMRERYDGNVFPCMGCRSFLSPWKDENGNYKFYGRFNRGVVTINLIDVALSSKGDMDKFWSILDERLELCKDALILRDSLLRGASANVSPIHWRYGGLARLGENDTIDKFLHGGYSTISLGYIGVYEMTQVMIGESHTEEEGKKFALAVMQHLNDKAKYWKENIDGLEGCSVYGTPSESLTYKFSKTLRKRFGEICGITDKDWQTNSYHVNVMEEIDAFTKLSIESEFQKLSPGGCVSYVELPDMTKNLDALSEIIEHMYNTMQYAEINLRGGDYCGNCGYTGEMEIVDGHWKCPHCGNTDTNKMSISRRVCGYINASPEINKGKMNEFENRVLHM